MKEPINAQAIYRRIALLYASKRLTPGIHFNVAQKIREAIVLDSAFNIKKTLNELAADRKNRAFRIQYANFYWIKRSLEEILTKEKDMPKELAKQTDNFIRGALSDYMQNYRELTISQKGRSKKDV